MSAPSERIHPWQRPTMGTFAAIVDERDAAAAVAALRSVLEETSLTTAPQTLTSYEEHRRRSFLHRIVTPDERTRRHVAFAQAGSAVVSGHASSRDAASRAVRALVDLDVHQINYDGRRGSELRMASPDDVRSTAMPSGPPTTTTSADDHGDVTASQRDVVWVLAS